MEPATLEQRLEYLERRFRMWRRIGIIFAVLVGTPVLAAFIAFLTVDRVHEGEGLLIRDKDLRVRINIGTSEDGSPRMMFYDSTGKSRIMMMVSKDNEPQIGMLDDNKQVRLMAFVIEEGPSLTLNDKEGKPRMTSAFLKDQILYTELRDGKAKQRFLVTHEENGASRMAFFDSQEKPRVLGVKPDDAPGMRLMDEKGAIRLGFDLDKDGKPVVIRAQP